MQAPFSWSRQYHARRAIAARFGKSVFWLPIARRVREVLVANVADGARVLEVGAGERDMGEWLARLRRDVRYESCDPDPEGRHEYRSLAEPTGPYDCVCAFEVVEHLALDEIRDWLPRLAALLRPGGRLILSTPNTFYPPDFLRDATHRTPLCYDELGGLVDLAGLRTIQLVRIYHDPLWRKFARRYLFGWLFRLIGIDFARQIVLVAERPLESSGA
jgi:SAM-dependent methyltransferase